MAIVATFQRYLDQHVMYDVIAHGPTMSAMRTAEACHIPGDCLAKGVVLRDDSGYMLAVLPATHHIRLRDLRLQFGNDVDLAGEGEIDKLFHDCAHGAILPIANAAASTPFVRSVSDTHVPGLWQADCLPMPARPATTCFIPRPLLRASSCQIFTPAQPTSSAASLRDFCPGAYN